MGSRLLVFEFADMCRYVPFLWISAGEKEKTGLDLLSLPDLKKGFQPIERL